MNKENLSIGTLNERSLHAFLKEYYEPKASCREVKVGRYVADILNSQGIIEIQTRGFSSLKKKLECFLKDYNVTLVYPVAKIKRLVWVDPKTGETSRPRLSPKTGSPFEIFYELVYIKDLLVSPNLRLKIVLLELDEYRFLDGWSGDRKKGSTRKDRVPAAIVGEVDVENAAQLVTLLPKSLPELFTAADLMKAARASKTLAYRAISVLRDAGAIEKAGKRGRAYLYRRAAQEKPL